MKNFNDLKIPTELIPTDPRFGSGPSVIPVEHLKKLAECSPHLIGTSHRKNQVLDLVKELQQNLIQYFNLPKDYTVILGNGGATFLWDMIGLGLCESASLHYTCGEFSQKWHAAHKKIPWIKTKNNSADFGYGIKAEYEEGFDLICTTLNETSTGVQNTYLPSVPENCLVLVDATSGAGQISCDLSKSDLYYFSPQKVFGGDGGLFLGFMSPKARARAEKIQKDNKRYIPVIMDWSLCMDNSSKYQTYNTPSILNLILVNEQLKLMNQWGAQKVEAMAKKKAELLYGWAESKSYLEPYVKNKENRSQAVATIDLDSSVDVNVLLKFLRDKKWVYDIDGYRKLERNQLRISMFHNISYENLEKLTQLISYIVEHK
jgi:phosphoserine aminotransferase